AADAMALFSKFESKLEEFRGNLKRASVELAKEWRTDRILRRLEALLVVADAENSYLISGSGDLIEPDDGILSIGSGGAYALAAARALLQYSKLDAKQICEQSMKIAADICIYTNNSILVEELLYAHSFASSSGGAERRSDSKTNWTGAGSLQRRTTPREASSCNCSSKSD